MYIDIQTVIRYARLHPMCCLRTQVILCTVDTCISLIVNLVCVTVFMMYHIHSPVRKPAKARPTVAPHATTAGVGHVSDDTILALLNDTTASLQQNVSYT
jgi:hypothetical protein